MTKIEETSSSSSMADSTLKPWESYYTVFTNAKAGIDGVDKEKVQRVVYEMSKGSKYFENENRKEAYMNHKIENMRANCEKLRATDLSNYQKMRQKEVAVGQSKGKKKQKHSPSNGKHIPVDASFFTKSSQNL